MKTLLTAALCAAAMIAGYAGTASAQSYTSTTTVSPTTGPVGEAGISLGYPTGFSGKAWLDPRDAVDLGIARNFFSTGWIANVDYLIHSRSIIGEDSTAARVPVYIGLGARAIRFDDGTARIGPRIPIGVEAMLTNAPLAVFAEVAPAFELGTHTTTVTADADIGARFVF